jgi:histidinol phosphatase-like PHP family hydrolase
MNLGKRHDFHSHTLLSDGELLLSEHIRRAEKNGYATMAVTDHADISNIDFILENINKFIEKEGKYYNVKIIPGVELTHVPPELIDELAKYSKERGAKIVVVHGETIVEPVIEKTNYYAVASKYVDILAHPGFITDEEVITAKENGIFLEITSRKGHSLTNGHVAAIAKKHGAKLILNTDTHSPADFINQEFAFKVAMAAGLTKEEAYNVVEKNPLLLMERLGV